MGLLLQVAPPAPHSLCCDGLFLFLNGLFLWTLASNLFLLLLVLFGGSGLPIAGSETCLELGPRLISIMGRVNPSHRKVEDSAQTGGHVRTRPAPWVIGVPASGAIKRMLLSQTTLVWRQLEPAVKHALYSLC